MDFAVSGNWQWKSLDIGVQQVRMKQRKENTSDLKKNERKIQKLALTC